jgi:hypothetical protein
MQNSMVLPMLMLTFFSSKARTVLFQLTFGLFMFQILVFVSSTIMQC